MERVYRQSAADTINTLDRDADTDYVQSPEDFVLLLPAAAVGHIQAEQGWLAREEREREVWQPGQLDRQKPNSQVMPTEPLPPPLPLPLRLLVLKPEQEGSQ